MIRIVITGKSSYIGNSIQNYVDNIEKEIFVTQLDVIGDAWKSFDFTGYDAVIHVAAIVHRKDVSDWELYRKVNTDLPIEIAQKAKAQGVKQFVFLSTMAVYGYEKTLLKRKCLIFDNKNLNSKSMYGKSKYLAEIALKELECEDFRVAIVRPPNVYGPGCKGGYITTYKRITEMLPVIPKAFTSVRQSVIYIDNLCDLIYRVILQRKNGIYTPQDDRAVSAVEIMDGISKILGLNKKKNSFIGLFIYLFSILPIVRKGYGGIAYSKEISQYEDIDYVKVTFDEGLKRTILYENKRNNPGL